jgi:hypothetical protein
MAAHLQEAQRLSNAPYQLGWLIRLLWPPLPLPSTPYLTLVYRIRIDLDVTRLLWVGKERTIESFHSFFTVIGEEIASKIVFVGSDMWEPYLKVIREQCSQALHILDRFHVVAKMNKALDEVRAGESRRMALEGLAPVPKKSPWLLLKREENPKTEQRFRLRDLLRYNLKTVRAYLLKEAFQQLWDYDCPAQAGKFLDEWCRQVMRSRIEPMSRREPQQHSQSHDAKILRIPNFSNARTGPLSLTWQSARARIRPPILLTNLLFDCNTATEDCPTKNFRMAEGQPARGTDPDHRDRDLPARA